MSKRISEAERARRAEQAKRARAPVGIVTVVERDVMGRRVVIETEHPVVLQLPNPAPRLGFEDASPTPFAREPVEPTTAPRSRIGSRTLALMLIAASLGRL
jgi:hypothetical protein